MVGCAAGLVACGDSTGQDEFPALAHGQIQGTVSGTEGQPLDSVDVTLVIPANLRAQFAFGTPGVLTDADGHFLLPVEIFTAPDPADLPDTVEVYVRASAFPPKYAPPTGEEKITDSVLVATALEPRENPAPLTAAPITLSVP
jgi:hypothetical protein